ncbi:hypothetical protein [Cupriavidus necator]|uniref:hypothetical protein n=1 Tax=Cupriavidus necator TaxID=106590 RepID=UPI0005A2E62C|nr:hypothetical protein [Cupriavidus necator]TPQ30848.1 hypothetical protein C2U69_30245 [Cupriavidus pinatubonensis]
MSTSIPITDIIQTWLDVSAHRHAAPSRSTETWTPALPRVCRSIVRQMAFVLTSMMLLGSAELANVNCRSLETFIVASGAW